MSSQFIELSSDVDDITIQRYARAYIMQLIGGFLFADKSNTLVHLIFLSLLGSFETAGRYSWGSACLAWLYRELCWVSTATALAIADPLILLQVWAYDWFYTIAPQVELPSPDHFIRRPFSARWSSILAASEHSVNMLLVYILSFDRLMHTQINWHCTHRRSWHRCRITAIMVKISG